MEKDVLENISCVWILKKGNRPTKNKIPLIYRQKYTKSRTCSNSSTCESLDDILRFTDDFPNL